MGHSLLLVAVASLSGLTSGVLQLINTQVPVPWCSTELQFASQIILDPATSPRSAAMHMGARMQQRGCRTSLPDPQG